MIEEGRRKSRYSRRRKVEKGGEEKEEEKEGHIFSQISPLSGRGLSLSLSFYDLVISVLLHSHTRHRRFLSLLNSYRCLQLQLKPSMGQTPRDTVWNPAVQQNQVSEINRLVSYKRRRDRRAAVALCQPVMKSLVVFIQYILA